MQEDQESYRDKISTVDEDGKRVWIFPKKPDGWWYDKRKVTSYVLLILLFAGPFITIGGEPALLLNVIERKFIVLGQIFWPQDLHLFALGMIIFVIAIALFTVVFGRLFCGWVCPQTIFMEMVFRRIEYLIEGDWKAQEKLKKGPWNTDKVIKKSIKHLVFWFISFLIANTFLAYIIGYQEVFGIAFDNPLNHITGLIAILVFTTVFYLVFSKMREQVCTVVCPYGRLQSVLLDRNSLVVAYDNVRGEDRAKFKKNEDRAESNKGDCIDCNQCVNVCPTGIDIRNGTQLECVNCTACIDACDFMMENVGLKKGLIRYASLEGIETQSSSFKITKRGKAYSVVLVLLIGILSTMLWTRSDFEASILRTRGTLFQEVEKGVFSNIYDINLVNKTNKTMPIEIRVIGELGAIKMIGKPMHLEPQESATSKFMVLINEEKLHSRNVELVIGVYSDDKLIEEVETKFIAPIL